MSSGGATIKILFFGANPSDTTRLALGREVREITHRLRASTRGARFEVVQEWAVRADDLSAALMRHRPQIVHFSGHGQRLADGGSPSLGSRGTLGPPANGGAKSASGLIVEDASGKHAAIEAGPLARLFALVGQQVRCVVLNACYSAMQAEAIGEHVDCVVGMSDAIRDESAIVNVWEWVADWYAPYKDAPTPPVDPVVRDKPVSESLRVIRGGGWFVSYASVVRAALRSRDDVSNRRTDVGFRCTRGPR